MLVGLVAAVCGVSPDELSPDGLSPEGVSCVAVVEHSHWVTGLACAVTGLSVEDCVKRSIRAALLPVAGKFHSRSLVLSAAAVNADNSMVRDDCWDLGVRRC